MTDIKTIGENITEVGDTLRIEPGPRMVTAIATDALLHDDRTAGHYAVGKIDSAGKVIVLGEEMTYAEWGGNDHPRDDVFKLYQWTAVPASDETTDTHRWIKLAEYDSRDEAISAAFAILNT